MRTPSKLVPLAALALVSATLTASVGTPAQADGPEHISNGTFDSGHAPWWGTGNLTLDSSTQQLCTDVPGGTVNPWDAIIGYDNVPLVNGESYSFKFKATASPEHVFKALVQLPTDPFTQYLSANPLVTPDQTGFEYTFTSPVDLPNGQVVFQIGGSATPWHLCLDDISLVGGVAPPVYTPDTGPRVRVNQVGYLTHGPKRATLVTDAASALPWQLVSGGTVVASGQTAPAGLDASSAQSVHTIDFSGYAHRGSGYTLVADGETSRPFDIGDDLYSKLRTDALKFYYPQRSGIAIDDALRPGYGRAAGHVGVAPNTGDTDVACQPGVCDYRLNVAGGWYDAGDHGKYVVNGGISVYQLMSEFERTKYARSSNGFTDGELNVPESGNGVPDLLDEARWEMDFLMSMQVPAGNPLAGMAHHKVHDSEWTGLPLMPAQDPKLRQLHPPSTAATLNLAATTAQAARLFAPYDAAYAQRNLAAARTAYAAAVANPAIYASPADGTGGGTYDDANVTDEFYWAAAELYLTTGEKQYLDAVLASPLHTADIWRERGFDWGNTAQLGRLDLATVPSKLPDRARVRTSVVEGANKYLSNVNSQAYGLSYAPSDARFDWGSNNLVLNNLVVMATAYDLTGDAKFQQGVVQGMDYLLGRNALNISYITGYGEVNAHNQHSRWYAKQLNPALPNPPVGTLSGGPNAGIQDPVAQQKLQGCVSQFCYIDDIESWSTNELTINWNSPLAWISAFLAAQGDASAPPKTGCKVAYTKLLDFGGLFASTVTVTNTSKSTVDGWSLRWAFWGGQKVTAPVNATTTQSGATVTASNEAWNARIKPGQSVTFAVIGQSGLGVNSDPTLFTLNGRACAR